nr:reverse transcriptase domain-containing protein [Tanacetum cinerariifolium]
ILKKMAPRRRTSRVTPAATTTPTTTVTDAQLQVLIDRGIAAALAERDADRSRNVKGLDLSNYNYRFQELALMCGRMFPEEAKRVERYIGGLPDMIHGSVKASKPQS